MPSVYHTWYHTTTEWSTHMGMSTFEGLKEPSLCGSMHHTENKPHTLKTLMQKIVVWIYDIFDSNFKIENDFRKYSKESCRYKYSD